MVGRDICSGDVIIFQSGAFDNVEHNKIAVVEKTGDEEGWGAWSLKRLIIQRPWSFRRNEFGEEIDWEGPDLVVRSYNRRISPWHLDPSGLYRIRGVLLRSLRPGDVHLVESEVLQRAIAEEADSASQRENLADGVAASV